MLTSSDIIKRHKVREIEHDSWSGSSCKNYYFDTKEKAVEYINIINKQNTGSKVPDFYVTAEYGGLVETIMVDNKIRELK